MSAIGGTRLGATAWLATNATGLNNLVTVGDALADLPVDGCEDGARGSAGVASGFSRVCGAGGLIYNHRPWRHDPTLTRRMSSVKKGGKWEPARERDYYSQAYARLHQGGLARTVTTNFHNPGSGRFTHYRAHRTLTVREAARRQGIPDSFRFIGFASWQERLVGNAFPPLWAKEIARQVRAQVEPSLG